jgi:acyl dehydratase
VAIDRRHVGYALPPFSVTVDAARLERFAQAIGERNPRLVSETAPPTFMKVLEGEHNSSRAILTALNVDLKRVLHAEQRFEYIAPILVGDTVTIERSITEIYERKNGAMEFIVIESRFTGRGQKLLGRSRQTVLVRNPAPKVAD